MEHSRDLIRVSFISNKLISILPTSIAKTLHIPEDIVASIPPVTLFPPVMPLALLFRFFLLLPLRRKRNLPLADHRRRIRRRRRFPVLEFGDTRSERLVLGSRSGFPLVRR